MLYILNFEMCLQQEKKYEIRDTGGYPRREDPITFQVSCKNNLYRSLLSQTTFDSDLHVLELCQVGTS